MSWNRRPRLAIPHKPTRDSRKLRACLAPVIEMLEKRELLAGEPLITEFLASNSNGLRDQFDRSSDWLAIRNPLSSNFDLSGYHLTDDTGDLTKWTFPTGTNLGGGGYMVVFASGDDVIIPNQPLHTNFELDGGGGYL